MAALGGLLAVTGCAPHISPIPPPPYRDRVAANYDATWTALIRVFARENLPMRAIARDSGVIASDDVISRIGVWADCGRAGDAHLEGEALVSFTVFVQPASDGMDVQINSKMRTQAHRTGKSGKLKPQPVYQCASTGRFEANLIDTVRSLVTR